MLKAPLPENEEARLSELLEYAILDTPPEINFDEIVYMASYVCQTPICLISIIDKERQWFKAKIGLNANQTERDISFCGHAIHYDDLFIVENAETDERFKDNPLVTAEPRVIFYAGAPLVTNKGFKIGTLCVIDHKPKTLTAEQKRILKSLSQMVIQNLEMNKILKKIHSEQKNLIFHAKMLSLGEMASGLAHEINNPLMIITGKLHLLDEYLKEKKNNLDEVFIASELKKVDATKDRIKEIIYNLRQFAKNSENEAYQPYSILILLNETLLLCKEKIKNRSIEIKISSDAELNNVKINCKPNLIRQAFLNLLLNAYDALENSPTKEIEVHFSVLADKLKIMFCDTGKGIPVEIRDKIMEPFFTTKEVGKGIGLGLSSTKGIVEEHNGKFYLDKSQPNTCFVMEFQYLKSEKI